MNKKREKYLTEIMEADEKDGLYNDPAQEEAKRLIELYLGRSLEEVTPGFVHQVEFAKENALKCCDEIMNEFQYKCDSVFGILERHNHWQAVKQAIENFEI